MSHAITAYPTRPETTMPSAKGSLMSGGALIVRINGYDGKSTSTNPAGQALFLNYEVEVDLPRAYATKDFDVPAAAAKDLPKGGGPAP